MGDYWVFGWVVAFSACFSVQPCSGNCTPIFPVLLPVGRWASASLCFGWDVANSSWLPINRSWLGKGRGPMTGHWESWGFLLFKHLCWGSWSWVVKMSVDHSSRYVNTSGRESAPWTGGKKKAKERRGTRWRRCSIPVVDAWLSYVLGHLVTD